MTRTKFKVTSVTREEGKLTGIVNLSTVPSGSPENEKVFYLTPAGSVVLQAVNPDVLSQFEVGKEFYVDFTSVF